MKIGLNYVVRAGRYYHFRYTVPQDVRPFIGRTEIKKSLKTDSWQQAVGRAQQIISRTLELVKNIRKHMVKIERRPDMEELIREVVRHAFHDSLASDEQHRVWRSPLPKQALSKEKPPKEKPSKEEPSKEEPSKEEPSKEEPSKEEPPKEEPPKEEPPKEEPSKEKPSKEEPSDDVSEEVAWLEGALKRERFALARNDLSTIYDYVVHYLTDLDYLDDFGHPADLTKLCRESLKAYIVQLQVELERAKGNYDNPYDQVTVDSFGTPGPIAAPLVRSPAAELPTPEAPPVGITLHQAIDGYIDEQMTAGVWLEKTKIESTAVLELLKVHFGDVPLIHLNHQRLLHFRDGVLRKVPAHRDRTPKYRGVKLADLLTLDIPESDRMSVDTQNKYLRRIGGLCGWAVRHEHLSTNPASGLQYKKTKRPDEERSGYSPENLLDMQTALVQLPTNCHAWKYWTPLLAVHSGMRQNEIAQLHLDDIVDKDGVPCFDVNGRGDDKRLKSKAARRLVPMHPHLVDLGFLDYVEELRRQGEKRVWPDLQKTRDGYGKPISRWFSRWRKKWLTPADLKQKKDFHSFRHTFDDRLKQAGVLDVRLPQLMGHSLETDQTFGRYGDLLRPPQLFEAVKLLDLGFDLDKLRREWK